MASVKTAGAVFFYPFSDLGATVCAIFSLIYRRTVHRNNTSGNFFNTGCIKVSSILRIAKGQKVFSFHYGFCRVLVQ